MCREFPHIPLGYFQLVYKVLDLVVKFKYILVLLQAIGAIFIFILISMFSVRASCQLETILWYCMQNLLLDGNAFSSPIPNFFTRWKYLSFSKHVSFKPSDLQDPLDPWAHVVRCTMRSHLYRQMLSLGKCFILTALHWRVGWLRLLMINMALYFKTLMNYEDWWL